MVIPLARDLVKVLPRDLSSTRLRSLCRGPGLGLTPPPAGPRQRARRNPGTLCPGPRARGHTRSPRRGTPAVRLAKATLRQLGKLRHRRYPPHACRAHADPRLAPAPSAGIVPPATLPGLAPHDVAPRLEAACGTLAGLELWQRAWLVGLLLRPSGWAARLQF